MHKKSPSKLWRKFNNRYSLVGNKSKKTGQIFYPPVLVEPESGNSEFSAHYFTKRGTLITWSKVDAAPNGFENYKPYIIGILELENGERLTTQIVDVEYDKLQKGDTLFPVFRKYFQDGDSGVIHYGLKWTKL